MKIRLLFLPEKLLWTTITITNTDPDESPYTITVKGTGSTKTQADIEVWEGSTQVIGSYYFEPVPEKQSGTPVVFTIKNKGNARLDISSILLTKGIKDFSLDTRLTSFSVEPGSSTNFTINFTPQQKGKRKGTLEIHSNELEGEGI